MASSCAVHPLPPPLAEATAAAAKQGAVFVLTQEGEEHLSRGDVFSALDAGMAAVKLAAMAVEEEEEKREAEGEKERAVTAATAAGNGERGGLANSSCAPHSSLFIPLSRPWRLVARAQSSLNKHWASAAAWRQAARLTEDDERAKEDDARAAEEDATAAADAAARYN